MENPLVSIVMPIYNGEKYLAKAIESCIMQDYQNWELIIVNDCSTDGTKDIIDLYKQRDIRIKIHNNNINLKLPKSLNIGFSKANGEYFTWTSDDNFFHPNALSKMVEFLQVNSGVDLIYTDFERVNENLEFLDFVSVGDPNQLIYGNCFGACFLYKKYVHFELNGYDESSFLAEDYDFWIRAYDKFICCPIHIVLYSYTVHSKSLTAVYENEVRDIVLRLMEEKILKHTKFTNNEKSKALFLSMAMAIKNDNSKLAEHFFELSIEYINYNYREYDFFFGGLKGLMNFCQRYEVTFIYGLGNIKKYINDFLILKNINIQDFGISNQEENDNSINHKNFAHISENLNSKEKIGIILGAGSLYNDVAIEKLRNIGYENFYVPSEVVWNSAVIYKFLSSIKNKNAGEFLEAESYLGNQESS